MFRARGVGAGSGPPAVRSTEQWVEISEQTQIQREHMGGGVAWGGGLQHVACPGGLLSSTRMSAK